jgi:hypothetical protein
VQPVDHCVDGDAQGVALGGVHPTCDGPVESQTGQMSSDRGVDDVGRRVVLTRGVEHRGNIDARNVRFSHIGYDAGETLRVPLDFSDAR